MSGSFLTQIKAQAMRYCAGAERSPFQVKEKLLSWKLTSEEADAIIAELESENFISEARFVRAFCHDKFMLNRWGKIKIKAEISRYKVDGSLVDAALSDIDKEKYRATLQDLLEGKRKQITKPFTKQQMQLKLINFGLSRGFEQGLVWDIVNQMSF